MIIGPHIILLPLTILAGALFVTGKTARTRTAANAAIAFVLLYSCLLIVFCGKSAMETRGDVPAGMATAWYEQGSLRTARIAATGVPYIILCSGILMLRGVLHRKKPTQPTAAGDANTRA